MIKSLFLFLALPSLLFASGVNQPLMDEAEEIKLIKIKEKSPPIELKSPIKAEEQSPFVDSGEWPSSKKKNNKRSQGQSILGDYENTPGLVEHSFRGHHREKEDLGEDLFSFQYVRDSFDYKDANGTYQKIFVESTGSQNPGMMLFSGAHYVSRRFLDLAVGLNLGVGYQYGYGAFSTGTRSDTRFSLWTIPLDLALHLETPITSWLKIAGSGGPSALFLIQNRSDREQGEDGKRVRQFGYGYFLSADFKISLSNLFPKSAFEYYKSYGITKTYLTIGARMVSYDNFKKEDLTVSGQSITAGFSFEYF